MPLYQDRKISLTYRIQGKFSRYIYWGGLVGGLVVLTDEPMSHL